MSIDFTTPGFVVPMSPGEQHFYDHAGFGYHPDRQTPDEGRRECARYLRTAEVEAERRGWRVDWEIDPEPIEDDVDRDEEYDQFVAVLFDADGVYLGSLGSIDLGPDVCLGYDARPHEFHGGPLAGEPLRKVYPPYVRVIEAELAADALSMMED